jgi:ATP-dependent protease ClpP protease subunit
MNDQDTLQSQYWNLRQTSRSVIELHIKGTIGSPEITEGMMRVAKRNIIRLQREIYEFGPAILEIHVKINSGGGFSSEGFGIYELLKNHKAKKLVFIDFMCGSAATIVAMAGDIIFMNANGRFFIHEAKNICIGSASDFLSLGRELAKIERAVRRLYAKKTKQLTDKRIERLLVRETNLSAQEALKLGFVDVILPASMDAEKEFGDYSPVKELLENKCLRCVFLAIAPWRDKA